MKGHSLGNPYFLSLPAYAVIGVGRQTRVNRRKNSDHKLASETSCSGDVLRFGRIESSSSRFRLQRTKHNFQEDVTSVSQRLIPKVRFYLNFQTFLTAQRAFNSM